MDKDHGCRIAGGVQAGFSAAAAIIPDFLVGDGPEKQ